MKMKRTTLSTLLIAGLSAGLSGAATHFGEKLADVPVRAMLGNWLAAQEPSLGSAVSIKAPGLKAVIARTVTGTTIDFESLAPSK
jgi:hypothetical protein